MHRVIQDKRTKKYLYMKTELDEKFYFTFNVSEAQKFKYEDDAITMWERITDLIGNYFQLVCIM